MGVLKFTEINIEEIGTSTGAYTGVLTDMTINFNFVTPKIVAHVLRKSKRISYLWNIRYLYQLYKNSKKL